MSSARGSRGGAEALRRLLAGAWREGAPCVEIAPADLAAAAGAALRCDAGALAWWALRGSPARDEPAAAPLRAAYLRSHLQAAVNERLLADALRALAARGIEALVVKGWAMARLYPSPGLRTSHDIDLVVDRRDLEAAVRARDELAPACGTDLHPAGGVSLLRGWDELRARAVPAPLGGAVAHVPGPEDALRLACLHGFRHDFSRPVWLCDVALLMERLPADLDRDHLLAGPPAVASWVRHALALAVELLGASPERVPPGLALPATPAWVRASVLRGWTRRPRPPGDPLVRVLRARPSELIGELAGRWASPMAALYAQGAAVRARRPTGLQVRCYLERSASFLGRELG